MTDYTFDDAIWLYDNGKEIISDRLLKLVTELQLYPDNEVRISNELSNLGADLVRMDRLLDDAEFQYSNMMLYNDARNGNYESWEDRFTEEEFENLMDKAESRFGMAVDEFLHAIHALQEYSQ